MATITMRSDGKVFEQLIPHTDIWRLGGIVGTLMELGYTTVTLTPETKKGPEVAMTLRAFMPNAS
jgi:hypothetical protein